jgi:hypothetical protein
VPPTNTAQPWGPADLGIDTSDCPPDPAQVGRILVGSNGGGLHGSRHLDGLREAFGLANEAGGIGGRPVQLVVDVATGPDGSEIRLAMTHGNPLAVCAGKVYFDLPLPGPSRINDLAPPITVRFEVEAATSITTENVTFPDDFPLEPPFENVGLSLTQN